VQAGRHPRLAEFVDKVLARPSFARSLAHDAKLLGG
jgi:hypothetical protein